MNTVFEVVDSFRVVKPRLIALCALTLSTCLITVQARSEETGDPAPPVPMPVWDAVSVPITRDTWVSSVQGERSANLGGAGRLKFKGIQEFAILDFDPLPLRGRVIRAAQLHLHRRSQPVLHRTTVSTITSPWVEGTSQRYLTQVGSASFQWAAQAKEPWAQHGSDITSVITGVGQSFWGFADPDESGHAKFTIPVLPRVLAARVAGISHGLVVMDDVGSEYVHDGSRFEHIQFPNRYTYSREARNKYSPFLTVYLGEEDSEPPGSVGRINSSISEPWLLPGEAHITWTTPEDIGPAGTIGYLVQIGAQTLDGGGDGSIAVPNYLVPPAGAPGQMVAMHLRDLGLTPGTSVTVRVRPIDAAGNSGPVSIELVELSPHWPTILKEDEPESDEGDELVPPQEDTPSPTTEPDQAPPPAQIYDPDTALFVIDILDKVNPTTGSLIPAQPPAYLHKNHLWSAATNRVTLRAARNEFVGFQVLLKNPGPDTKLQWRWSSPQPSSTATTQPTTESAKSNQQEAPQAPAETAGSEPVIKLLRSAYVKSEIGLMPDPLVPIDDTAAPPVPPGVTYRSYMVEVYVPHDARAGDHQGTLLIHQADQATEIAVDLQVWRFTLPDFLSFIPQMNCYGLPEPPHELGYYRLAHEHRTVLNRLPYNWRGRVRAGWGPQWYDDHMDWEAFDTRFGPILDGSAFEDLPRRGVPVDAFYLPINENWPMDIFASFEDDYWADRALPQAYWDQLTEASRRIAEHFDHKRWFNTFFEFYLNNKIYFKRSDWNAGSAPWIFDEPVNTQDFWALRQYGRAFHNGVAAAGGRAKMVFRCDISRPQWQRDLLDGILDINVVSGALRQYERRVMDNKVMHQQIVYQYGGASPIEQSNIQPAAWCIDAWRRGADGVLPWQTIGRSRAWTHADSQAVIYPSYLTPNRLTLQNQTQTKTNDNQQHPDTTNPPTTSPGPFPSNRLKAFRRGQQDVEYLVMLSEVLKVPRAAVAARVSEILNLKAQLHTKGNDDAGRLSYTQLTSQELWALRTRVGAILDEAAPPLKRRWLHLRTPNRDMSIVRDEPYMAPHPSVVRANSLLNLLTPSESKALSAAAPVDQN